MEMTKKLALVAIILVFLITRLLGIGGDMSNSDAGRWHRRSEDFLQALRTGDLDSTYQHYQPGVTLMWLNSATKLVVYFFQNDQTKTLENADWFPIIDGISKAVLIVVLGALLSVQMYLISKLYSKKIALIYGFILAFEPYMIGIDRWFHLTSLETYFAFTSLLSLIYWSETKIKKYLLFSAVLLSLSILSKITTLILIPLFLLIIFLANKRIKDIISYLLIVLVCTFLLFPAFWVNSPEVLAKFWSAITNAVGNDARAIELPFLISLFFYPLILLFKLSPITLALLILIFKIKKKQINLKTKYIFIYFMYYLIILTIPVKKIDRYALVLIPPMLLLLSIYLSEFKNKFIFSILSLTVLFFAYVIYATYPVYSAYYSPLFGGTKGAVNLGIYDNSGEYFAQAGKFLNEQGRDNYTYVPDNYESFSYYYKGNIQRGYDENTNFVVRSIDIDRKIITDEKCPYVAQTFGPNDYDVIYVLICPKVIK